MLDCKGAEGMAALLVIDMQNSFLHRDGGNYFPEADRVAQETQRLLKQARDNHLTIIHVAERHRMDLDDFEYAKLPEHCVSGTFDADFYEGFGPKGPNEFLLPKRRVSAFFSTDLDLLLRERRINRLIVAGVKTNVCVRATVIDGFSLGYRCLVVRDAVASNRENLADAALEDIERYFGWVVSSEQALEELA